jgi:MFS family permease
MGLNTPATPGPAHAAPAAVRSPPGAATLAASYSLGYGGYVGSLILIPVVAHDYFGANLLFTSVAFAAANISLFIFSFIFGRHADVHGRGRILKTGLFLSSIAIFVQIFVWDLWSLIAVRTLVGVTVAMFPAALVSYAHHSGWRMGRFSSFGSLAWAIGAVLTMASGVVGAARIPLGPVTLVGYQVTFLLGGVSTLAAYVLALRLPPLEERLLDVERNPVRMIRRNAHVYLGFLVRHTGAASVWVTFPLYIELLGGGRADAHLFIGATNFINTCSQFLFMPLLDRVPRPRALISGGMVGTALTFAVFIAVPDLYGLLAAQVLLGFSWSMLYVGSIRELVDRNRETATVTGLLGSTTNVAQIIGPLLGGVVGAWAVARAASGGASAPEAALLGYQATMWLAAALALAGLVVQLSVQSILKETRTQTPGQAAKAG